MWDPRRVCAELGRAHPGRPRGTTTVQRGHCLEVALVGSTWVALLECPRPAPIRAGVAKNSSMPSVLSRILSSCTSTSRVVVSNYLALWVELRSELGVTPAGQRSLAHLCHPHNRVTEWDHTVSPSPHRMGLGSGICVSYPDLI